MSDTNELVERLRDPADRYCTQSVRDEAASLIQSQAARIAELEAAIRGLLDCPDTGELIDKMAEAIRGDTASDDTPWATLSEDHKIGWRGDAERAPAVVKEYLTARLPAPEGHHPDDIAVDRFAAAMKEKLARKREEGRGGWDDKEKCSGEYLSRLLREHVDKGDPVDVGNLAMMLHQRGERIAPEGQQDDEPVAYQQRESRDDGKTWSDWYPTTREAFEEYTRNVASRYVSGKWTFEARALYAHPPAQAGAVTEIAEIIYRAYGFDPAGKTEKADGTPYGEWAKAVEAATRLTAALGAQTPPEGAVTEAQGWRDMASAPRDGSMVLVASNRVYPAVQPARWQGTDADASSFQYWDAWHHWFQDDDLLGWMPLPTPPVNQSEGAE